MENVYIGAADFFKSLKPDERVYLLIRHGERDHIRPDDPDHGAFVGLTAEGREQAFELGRCIPAEGDIVFFSSPVGRCMQTAELIGRGRIASQFGNVPANTSVQVTPLQPLAEFFVEHYDAYMETHMTGFYQGICRWLDGTANVSGYLDPAYYPLASRVQELHQLMLEKGNARFNIFCSHDAWIVPCLFHYFGFKFTPNYWMNFLTGLAIVVGPQGEKLVPLTGLNNGNLLF